MSEFIVEEENRNKLALYIKQNREARGIGLNQLALKAGLQKTIVSRLESGKILKINPFFLKQLAEALGKDYKELYRIVGYLENEGEIKSNGRIVDLSVCELPVYGKAAAGDGYINLDNIIYTKRVIANGFSKNSFLVEVAGDSMTPEINDGDFALVDPMENDYISGKVYVVTYGDETLIKKIECPAENIVVLKSYNAKYPDKYIMDEQIEGLKIEGRVLKVISEKRF